MPPLARRSVKGDDQLAAVNITRDAFHPEWNYTIPHQLVKQTTPKQVYLVMRPAGFEPATLGLEVPCSIP